MLEPSLVLAGLEAAERVLGTEHPDTLLCIHNLAFLLYHETDYTQAEDLYRRALEATDRVLGSEHPNTTTTLQHLFNSLEKMGKTKESDLLREAYIDRVASQPNVTPLH